MPAGDPVEAEDADRGDADRGGLGAVSGPVESAEPAGIDALGDPGGPVDLAAMMEMAQDMSQRLGTAQAELTEARVEGSAGGGLVEVVLNGHLHLLSVEVDPAAVDPDDPSIVGDLVVAAWRDAHDGVARLQADADPLGGLGSMLGGGLDDLLGGG